MTKQEFLDRLRMSLHGKIPPGQVVENLQFYEDYINTEIRKGAAEEEVMAGLGDPRLLARTIVETRGGQSAEYTGGRYGGQGTAGGWYEEQEGGTDTRYEGQDGSGTWYEAREEYRPYEQPGERRLSLLANVPVWAWLLLVLLIIVLAVSAVFSLLAAVFPILLPILLVLLAVKIFRE